jgi:hypothetical protein
LRLVRFGAQDEAEPSVMFAWCVWVCRMNVTATRDPGASDLTASSSA